MIPIHSATTPAPGRKAGVEGCEPPTLWTMVHSAMVAFPLLLLAMASLGCSTSRFSLNRDDRQTESIAAAPPRREMVDNFEQRRTQAQLLAALARQADGDLAGCENQVRQILARQPENTEARLVLADILTATQRFSQAEEQLRNILACSPRNAQAHYQLGLLLEVTGRSDEGLNSLVTAAELEPANDHYRKFARIAARDTQGIRPTMPSQHFTVVEPDRSAVRQVVHEE